MSKQTAQNAAIDEMSDEAQPTLEQRILDLTQTNQDYEEYIETLKEGLTLAQLPEAAASLNVILNAPTLDGNYTIQFTARGQSAESAIDSLYKGMRYAYEKYGWRPVMPKAAAPQPAGGAPMPASTPRPAGMPVPLAAAHGTPPQSKAPGYTEGQPLPEDPIKLKVQSVAHQVHTDGQHYILVTTDHPRFRKYGVKAWKQALPADVVTNYEEWAVGEKYAPPASMQFATTAPLNKKVAFFTEE